MNDEHFDKSAKKIKLSLFICSQFSGNIDAKHEGAWTREYRCVTTTNTIPLSKLNSEF